MNRKTALFDQHESLGAKIVDFGGWNMPLHYGSQVKEHNVIRQSAGMFDVSHMGVIDLEGEMVTDLLRKLLANDIGRLKATGKAMYSCMLNEDGGVIDDLIVYAMSDERCRIIVNAVTKDKDVAWISQRADIYSVEVTERKELAVMAVQGPESKQKLMQSLPEFSSDIDALQVFFAIECGDYFISRTGYTGEDGFEIVLPAKKAVGFWNTLVDSGVIPCGLGARDTLRLEAGMNLYGTDMDEEISPLESGLEWTVAWTPENRNFIGKKSLERLKESGIKTKFVGLVLNGRGVFRGGQAVIVDGLENGIITSGTFSPTLKKAIAFARVPVDTGEKCFVDIRGKLHEATVVKLPFVRNGQVIV